MVLGSNTFASCMLESVSRWARGEHPCFEDERGELGPATAREHGVIGAEYGAAVGELVPDEPAQIGVSAYFAGAALRNERSAALAVGAGWAETAARFVGAPAATADDGRGKSWAAAHASGFRANRVDGPRSAIAFYEFLTYCGGSGDALPVRTRPHASGAPATTAFGRL